MTTFEVSISGTFKDHETKALIDQYRQLVAQRYTPSSPADLGRMLAAPPFHVSRKIDGELWFLVVGTSAAQLVAANGRVVSGDCTILQHAKDLPENSILAGELFVHQSGTRERVGDVSAALASGSQDLAFAVFDLVRQGEVTWRETPYAERLRVIQEALPDSGVLATIPVLTVGSEADVVGIYQDIVDRDGAEGIIVRCADGRALKVKPERNVDCAVLGFTSRESSGGTPEIRSLLLGLASPDTDTYLVAGTVGNIAETLDRKALLDLLQPLTCASQYRQAASSGQLYYMVEPQHIIECRILDVQVEDSKGRSIRRPQLHFENGEWSVTGNVQAATLINPTALRLREDKADLREGAGWDQISDVATGPSVQAPDHAASEVIQRRVWVKTTKDKTDVRKLVVWKTNKDHIDPVFPAYVVHWTDYSAGRKTPLTREVRPAPSEEVATSIADGLIEANIKKGWAEQSMH